MEESEKDTHIELLRDTLSDLREQNRFIKRIAFFLGMVVVLCIVAIVGLSVYHNERFAKFLLEYDVTIENSLNSDNNSDGTITVSR